jgi:tape measure domain-containing protein
MSGTAGRLNVELSANGLDKVESDFLRLENRVRTLSSVQRQYEQDVAVVQRTMAQNPALIGRGTQALESLHQQFLRGTTASNGFDNALQGLGTSAADLAGRLGPLGSVLSAIGPGGIAAAAGLAAAGLGASQVAKAGDDMVASLGRIRAATGNIEAAAVVYEQLYKLSLQTGQAISDSAGQFARFAIASKEIGATNAQAVKLVEILQKAGAVGGATTQEAASAALQLGQALASGVLQGEELMSLLSNMPNLGVLLARELGVGVGQLRAMGSEGKLTADIVMPALLRAGQEINAEYDKMPTTMSRAFDQLDVASGNFLARMDKALGLSQRLATSLSAAAKALDSTTSRVFLSAAQAEENRAAALSQRAEDLRGRIRAAEADGPSATATRGGYQRRAQIVGSINAGGDLVADMKEELAAVEREVAQSNQNRLAILRDGREDQRAEEADAAQRRLDNQRTATARETAELRTGLDKDLATRQAWQQKVDKIKGLVGKPGGLSDVEAERLITLATQERDEALKKLVGTQKTVHEGRNEELELTKTLNQETNRAFDQEAKRQDDIRQAAKDAIEANDQQLQLLQTEAGLLSSNADVRERELALVRERVRITKAGITDEEQIATLLRQRGELFDQEKALTQQKNSFTELAQVGERAFDRIGTAITSAFADGSLQMLDFGNIAKAVLSEVAQAALRLAVINPVLNSVLGGSRGTVSGLLGSTAFTGVGGGSTASGGGGTLSLMDAGNGLYKLSGMSGAGSSLTSGLVSSFDSYAAGLSPGLFSAGSATNNALVSSLGAGVYGPATPGAVAAAEASPSMFSTASGTIGGAAGVVGGAYGIYSGIQKGGIGGAVGAAGGVAGVVGGLGTLAAAGGAVGGGLMAAAPWLAAAGPYGLAAAAVLAIVSAFLPGQKPSDMTGVYKNNLLTGQSEITGLTGERFSQANRDLAVQIGDQVKTLAQGLQTVTGASAIPFNYEIKAGNRDGIAALYDGSWHEYDRNEESVSQLVKDMTQSLLNSMKGLASAEVQSILSHSATSDAALENLDWYNGTYKAMTAPLKEAEAAASAFAQQMTALRAPFDAAIAKATELGLATDVLAQREAEATQKLVDARSQTIKDLLQGSTDRIITANTGSPGIQRQLEVFYREQDAARRAMADQVRTLGVGEDVVNKVLSSMVDAATAEAGEYRRQYQVNQFSSMSGLQDRQAAADGTGSTLGGALWSFDRKALLEREAASRDGVTDMVQLEKTLASERLAIIRDYNQQAAAAEQQRVQAALNAELEGLRKLQSQSGILTGFLDSQALSGPGISPQRTLLETQRQYQEALDSARNGGDLSAYTSAAGTLIASSSNYFGGGPQAAALREMVLSTTRSLGASLDLPGFSASWEAGFARHLPPVVDALGSLKDEVSQLREEMRSMRMRAA